MPSAQWRESTATEAAAWVPAEVPSAGGPAVGNVEMCEPWQLQAGAGKGLPKCKPG